jgi:Rrf2 family protein
MVRVSRPTNTQFALGVHLLTLLGDACGAVLSSETMADSAGASPVHVRRLLGRLRVAGLVGSRSGVHGGWQLLRDPEAITLADVWRALNGDDPVLGLRSANPDCPVGRSIQISLAAIDRRAATAIESELGTTTIAQLVAEAAARAEDRTAAGR